MIIEEEEEAEADEMDDLDSLKSYKVRRETTKSRKYSMTHLSSKTTTTISNGEENTKHSLFDTTSIINNIPLTCYPLVLKISSINLRLRRWLPTVVIFKK